MVLDELNQSSLEEDCNWVETDVAWNHSAFVTS